MAEKNNFDDFKFDPGVQENRKKQAAFLNMIRNSLLVVKEGFTASSSTNQDISSFYLHQALPAPIVHNAFTGNWNNCTVYISTISYYSAVTVGKVRSAGYDNYLIGVITLKEKYPHTIIQPEVLALKIENLFTRRDVDFSHARIFSFLFYVITKDKTLLKKLLKDRELNRINTFLDAEIEITGTQCYFRCSRKAISVAEAKKFVQLGKLITEIF